MLYNYPLYKQFFPSATKKGLQASSSQDYKGELWATCSPVSQLCYHDGKQDPVLFASAESHLYTFPHTYVTNILTRFSGGGYLSYQRLPREEHGDMKSETSCHNTKAIIDYVRSNNPENLHLLFEPLRGILPEGDDPELFLTDQNNWISVEVCRAVMEAAKRATSDEMAMYKAGFESITQKRLGYIGRIVVRALFSPKYAIQKAPKINDKVNKTKKVEIVTASNTHAIVRLHWFEGFPVTRDFCLINKGIYQAMSTIWDLPPASLEETVCFFEGGPYCEYDMRWEKKSLMKLFFHRRKLRREVLDSLLKEMETDKDIIRQKYQQVTQLNVELEEKIAYLMSLQEASQAVVSILDEQSLIQTIMDLLTTVIGFNRAVLFLVDEKHENLRFAQASGAVDELVQPLTGYDIPLDRMSNIIARVAATGRPIYVKDVKKSGLRQENIIIHTFQPENFSAAPLIARIWPFLTKLLLP